MAAGSSTSPTETVTLKLPSGEEVDAVVPHGYSDMQIQGLIRAKHPEFFPQQGAGMAPPQIENAGFNPMNLLSNVAKTGVGMAAGVGSMVKDIATNPNWVTGPDSTFAKFIQRPQAEQAKKADEAQARGDQLGRAGHILAGAIPFIGPAAAQVGEQAGTGDIGGALASGATMALAPKIAEKGMGAVGGAAKLVGAKTRAIDAFNRIEGAYGDAPVDHVPTLALAQKAVELGKKGYTVPKPATDFIAWVESKMQKPSLTPVPGQTGAFTEAGPTQFPLALKDARQFFTSIGEAIPWDTLGEGAKGGRMYRIMQDMYRTLDQSTRKTLEGYSPQVADAFDAAKNDYARAMNWPKMARAVGYIGGKLGGYAVGAETGHPFMVGYAGGKLGSQAAESAARKITEAGSKRQIPVPPLPLMSPQQP